jgi:hypothetical protein
VVVALVLDVVRTGRDEVGSCSDRLELPPSLPLTYESMNTSDCSQAGQHQYGDGDRGAHPARIAPDARVRQYPGL